MAKTNYSKVELALEEGLRKMNISRLGHLSDIVTTGSEMSKNEGHLTKKQRILIKKTTMNLRRLEKKDPKIYQKIDISKKYLQDKLAHPENLNEAEWRGLAVLYEEIQKQIETTFFDDTDEKVLQDQLLAEQTRRINVSDNWLAL